MCPVLTSFQGVLIKGFHTVHHLPLLYTYILYMYMMRANKLTTAAVQGSGLSGPTHHYSVFSCSCNVQGSICTYTIAYTLYMYIPDL